MGWLRNVGRGAAIYFGLTDGPVERQGSVAYEESSPWPGVLIRIVPILLALAVLRRLLGLQDDVAGLLIQLALVVLLSVVWGAVLLVILRYRGSSR
jgi:hypothetical protein